MTLVAGITKTIQERDIALHLVTIDKVRRVLGSHNGMIEAKGKWRGGRLARFLLAVWWGWVVFREPV